MKTRPVNYSPMDEGHSSRLETGVDLAGLGDYPSLRDILDNTKKTIVHIILINLTVLTVMQVSLFFALSPRWSSPIFVRLSLIIGTGLVVSLYSSWVFALVLRHSNAKRDAIAYNILTTNEKLLCKMENDVLNSLTVSR